jgi:cytochrome c oxidase subunit 4
MSHHANTPTNAQGREIPIHDEHGHHGHHDHGTLTYWIVFLALMVLLVATVGVAYVHLGVFNIPVAYAIATLKAVLILWFFMHLSESTRLVQVFAFASFAWLLIFLVMTSGDYISRNLLPRADSVTKIRRVDSYDQQSGGLRNRIPGGTENASYGSAPSPSAGHQSSPPITQPAK